MNDIEKIYIDLSSPIRRSITKEELVLNELTNSNDWNYIFRDYILDEESLEYFKDKIDWLGYLKFNNTISSSILEKYFDYIDWTYVSIYFKMTPELLDRFKYLLNWETLYEWHKVSEVYSPTF